MPKKSEQKPKITAPRANVNSKYTIALKEEAIALLHIKPFEEVRSILNNSHNLNIGKSTLHKWKTASGLFKDNKVIQQEQLELTSMCEEERREQVSKFVATTWEATLNTAEAINKQIKSISEDTERVSQLIDFILTNASEVSKECGIRYDEIRELMVVLRRLKDFKIKDLATVLSVTYDKHALATGKSTQNVSLSFEDMPE